MLAIVSLAIEKHVINYSKKKKKFEYNYNPTLSLSPCALTFEDLFTPCNP